MPPRTFLRLPAAFWRLFAATLVNRLGGFVVPFLSLYLANERRVPVSTAGVIVAFFGAGAIVAGPFGGVFADRFGRKPAIVAGMALTAASLLVLGCAESHVSLALACFFTGLFTEVPRPATSALVADLVPPELRTRAYAAIYWAANLGFACASLVAGVVSSSSFYVLFVVDAATCLACAAIVAFGVPEARRTARAGGTRSSLHDVTIPFRDRAFRRFFAATLAIALVFFQFQLAVPLDLRAHGVSTRAYGALVALNGVLVIALQPFTTRFVTRLPRPFALALSAVLTAVGFGLFGVARSVALYAAAITVFTLGEVTMAPVNPTVVSDLAPPGLRATYQGAYLLAFSSASCVAPLLGGVVLDHLGGGVLWGGCLLVGLFAAALHLGRRSSQPESESAGGVVAE